MVYVMNTGSNRKDWVGQVIDGRFPLLEWLGDSERSSVFRTELPGDGPRKAAVKLILAEAGEAEARLDLWTRTSAFSHPHLMRLFHAGLCPSGAGPLLYVVTEYAEENLSQILPERPLTPAEAAEMLPPILDALAYLHEKGFAQASLKPSNLLVVDDQLKLSSDRLQGTGPHGSRVSAPRIYDAPECATGTFSPATDIWALGATLVEALSQHPPVWARESGGEPKIPGSLPQPYAGIARECLRSDPARRCSLAEVKARLDGSPASSPGLPKSRWLALAAAALVLIALIAVLHSYFHPATQPAPGADEQPAAAMPALPAPAPAPVAASTPASASAPAPVAEKQRSSGAGGKGAVAEQVLPEVPAKASATIRGKVEIGVRVAVDPTGAVTNAELESPSSSQYFANLALQAARRWRFQPARTAGQPVASEWVLHFHFEPDKTDVTPVETVQ